MEVVEPEVEAEAVVEGAGGGEVVGVEATRYPQELNAH